MPAGMGGGPARRLLPQEPARAPRVGVGHRPRPPRRAGAHRMAAPALALGRQVRDAAVGRSRSPSASRSRSTACGRSRRWPSRTSSSRTPRSCAPTPTRSATRDDASLVIYAPGRQPAEIAGALGQAMRQAGIQEAGCPDLLVVAADGGREGEAALAGAVDAAYTRRNRDGCVRRCSTTSTTVASPTCGCSRSGAGGAWRRELRRPCRSSGRGRCSTRTATRTRLART